MSAAPLAADVVVAFVKRCKAEWVEAGLGECIEDEAVLDRIAAAVVTRTAPETD